MRDVNLSQNMTRAIQIEATTPMDRMIFMMNPP
jgi:hypothetical protein